MRILFNKGPKLVRTFQPPPKPPPQRVLSGGEVNEQKECVFLTKLPSEIRNQIYYLVFVTPNVIKNDRKSIEEEGDRLDEEDLAFPSLRSLTEHEHENKRKRSSGSKEEENRTAATQDADVDRFASNVSEPDVERALPAHPLSLLLTCRKVSQEATILAFNTYTFTLGSTITTAFFALRQSTAHLSPGQCSAITSLALNLPRVLERGHYSASDFLTNTLLLFPSILRLTIRVHEGKLANQQAHVSEIPFPTNFEDRVRETALRRYVPKWFGGTLQDTVSGRSFSWQTGSKWRVEWPQFESAAYTQEMEYVNDREGWQITGSMSPETAGAVDGVELCVCGCGALCWLTAHLIQENGRKVEVGVVYYGRLEVERMKIRLEPLDEGGEPLPVQWLQGGEAATWEMDENYWSELGANWQARKKGLIALLR